MFTVFPSRLKTTEMATPAKVPRHEDGEAKEEILADFGSFQFERVLSENSER